MSTVVLDASAAVQTLLDPAGNSACHERLVNAGTVLAPTLFVSETANAFAQYVRHGLVSPSRALEHHADACALVTLLIPDVELFPDALELACERRHPVYDMMYLALVLRYEQPVLLSLDRRLLAAARALDITVAPGLP